MSRRDYVDMHTDTIASSQVTAPPLNLELGLVDGQTPPLMIGLEAVSAAYSSLRAALPGFKILYAMKANPHPEIVNTLARCGSGFEVASGAELQILLDCDIETRDVMFSNPVKAPLDIRGAYDSGVACYSFDSDSEIVKLALEAPGSRIRPAGDDGFGEPVSPVEKIRRWASRGRRTAEACSQLRPGAVRLHVSRRLSKHRAPELGQPDRGLRLRDERVRATPWIPFAVAEHRGWLARSMRRGSGSSTRGIWLVHIGFPRETPVSRRARCGARPRTRSERRCCGQHRQSLASTRSPSLYGWPL